MAIKRINILTVSFPHDKTFDMLLKVKELTDFHPQKAKKIIDGVKKVSTMPKVEAYSQIITRIHELSVKLNLELEELPYHNEQLDCKKANDYLDEVENAVNQIEKVKHELEVEKDENIATQTILENIEGHELNLDQLFNSRYMKVRVGRIPTRNMPKLEYYDGYPFMLRVYKESSLYTWCAYFAVNKDILEIDNVFSSIGFERIRVPAFVHGTAKDALKEVIEETRAMDEYISRMDQKIKVLKEEHRLQIDKIYTQAKKLDELYSIHDCVIDYSYSATINGFVETDKLDTIRKEFEQIEGVKTLVLPESLYEEQGIYPPVIRHNHPFIRPFEKFSKIKSYASSMDLALPIALLWMLTFGIFLGDIAVGAILAILGFIFAKKSDVFKIINRVGLSMFVFGLIYGTSFYQSVYPAVVTLPINGLLKVVYALCCLVLGYYVIGALSNMMVNIKEKHNIDAVLGFKALSGLFIIGCIVTVVLAQVQFGRNFLNLPLECIVAVVLVLTLFKSKIKSIFEK